MLGFLGRSCFLFDMSFNWLQIYFFVSHLTEPVPKASKEFKPILSRPQELGGSNTQRQLFKQIFDDAHREVIINNHYHRHYEAIAS